MELGLWKGKLRREAGRGLVHRWEKCVANAGNIGKKTGIARMKFRMARKFGLYVCGFLQESIFFCVCDPLVRKNENVALGPFLGAGTIMFCLLPFVAVFLRRKTQQVVISFSVTLTEGFEKMRKEMSGELNTGAP